MSDVKKCNREWSERKKIMTFWMFTLGCKSNLRATDSFIIKIEVGMYLSIEVIHFLFVSSSPNYKSYRLYLTDNLHLNQQE